MSPQPVCGPDGVPLPETLARRVHMLARTPGALISEVDAQRLLVICEDGPVMERALKRITGAVALVRCDYSWFRTDGYTFEVFLK